MQARHVRDVQIDGARIGHLAGERNLVPAEARPAHVDSKQAAIRPPARYQPGRRFERQPGMTGLGADQRRHAAHAVAASARLRPVVIENADRSVAAGIRRIERHELVVGLLARGGAGLGRRDRGFHDQTWHAAQIDNNDLVAETVHLDEVAIRQRAHDNARMCTTYMRS